MAYVNEHCNHYPTKEFLPDLYIFEKAIHEEIKNAHGQQELFLRSNTSLSILLKETGHRYGRGYFQYIVGDAIDYLSTPVPTSEEAEMTRILSCAGGIIHRLEKSFDTAPPIIRIICRYILDQFSACFPNSSNGPQIVVGGFLFLRVICPSLTNPNLLGLRQHSKQSLRQSIQVAKILQQLLRMKQVNLHSQPLNEFIYSNTIVMENIIHSFPQSSDWVRKRLTCGDYATCLNEITTSVNQYESKRTKEAGPRISNTGFRKLKSLKFWKHNSVK